jgi:ATP-binding cassette subfamily B protein
MTDEHYEDDKDRKLDLQLWRRILSHARPYRRELMGLAASGLVLAATDSVLPAITGRVIDIATTEGVGSKLWTNSALYFALVSAIAVLIWVFILLAGRIATGYAHDVRRAAFAHLQELSFSFYDTRPVGWLMARMTSDCQRLASMIPWTLLDLVWGSALLIGISVMMLLLNWKLALFVMLIIPPLAVVSVVFQKRLIRTQRKVRKTNSLITAAFNEGIMGVKTTKALVREEENLGEFQVLTTTMYDHSVRNALYAAAYLPIVMSLGAVGVGLALWKGGLDIGLGDMTLGTLVAFMQYAALFYIPIEEMAARFTQLQAAQASAERLQGLLDTEPAIQDTPDVRQAVDRNRWRARCAPVEVYRAQPGDPVRITGSPAGGNSRPLDLSEDHDFGLGAPLDLRGPIAVDGHDGRIDRMVFDNVSFAYKEGEWVLRDFDLEVTAGDTIALVGATGSGKSTIVSLAGRFYEPTRGRITINGVDYQERSLIWLQSQLGIVLQSPHLFSGSIRDNIRYGRLDASDDEIVAAARLVNADGFISALEDGYDTDVGEGGSRLSTGQKQLVSLARAVLADPQIFIMDEATSSVDTETEKLIQEGIERVLEGRISFIIAHRLSTIRSADRILVIESGRIAESGDHAELMRLGGRYYELYTNQFTRESQEQALRDGVES